MRGEGDGGHGGFSGGEDRGHEGHSEQRGHGQGGREGDAYIAHAVSSAAAVVVVVGEEIIVVRRQAQKTGGRRRDQRKRKRQRQRCQRYGGGGRGRRGARTARARKSQHCPSPRCRSRAGLVPRGQQQQQQQSQGRSSALLRRGVRGRPASRIPESLHLPVRILTVQPPRGAVEIRQERGDQPHGRAVLRPSAPLRVGTLGTTSRGARRSQAGQYTGVGKLFDGEIGGLWERLFRDRSR
mmetsp:Transcript_5701/g.12483  ORF Transcript_5701/g.12483 Transcript_5701/m.12483 type:complete len:239 (+) Transcript_5701:850-1566(+)